MFTMEKERSGAAAYQEWMPCHGSHLYVNARSGQQADEHHPRVCTQLVLRSLIVRSFLATRLFRFFLPFRTDQPCRDTRLYVFSF